jgi:hypothetical protein
MNLCYKINVKRFCINKTYVQDFILLYIKLQFQGLLFSSSSFSVSVNIYNHKSKKIKYIQQHKMFEFTYIRPAIATNHGFDTKNNQINETVSRADYNMR